MSQGISVDVRRAIVKEAQSWLGTPFAHFQCCKGAGVDCAHLIIGVGKAVGLLAADFQVPYYSPQWLMATKARLLLDTLAHAGFHEKSPKERVLGDVLVFEVSKVECHVGIDVGNNEMIHTHHSRVNARVRLFPLQGSWGGIYLTRAFCYPGLGV